MLKSGLLADGCTVSYKFEQVDVICFSMGTKWSTTSIQVNGALLHAHA
jgi:hypothetical protein